LPSSVSTRGSAASPPADARGGDGAVQLGQLQHGHAAQGGGIVTQPGSCAGYGIEPVQLRAGPRSGLLIRLQVVVAHRQQVATLPGFDVLHGGQDTVHGQRLQAGRGRSLDQHGDRGVHLGLQRGAARQQGSQGGRQHRDLPAEYMADAARRVIGGRAG